MQKQNTVGHLAKLTARQVRWARNQFTNKTKSTRELAEKLDISQTAVSFMLNRKTYQHVK